MSMAPSGSDTHGERERDQLHRVHVPAAAGVRLCAPMPRAWCTRAGELCPEPALQCALFLHTSCLLGHLDLEQLRSAVIQALV